MAQALEAAPGEGVVAGAPRCVDQYVDAPKLRRGCAGYTFASGVGCDVSEHDDGFSPQLLDRGRHRVRSIPIASAVFDTFH